MPFRHERLRLAWAPAITALTNSIPKAVANNGVSFSLPQKSRPLCRSHEIRALDSGSQGCVYASEAATGDIVGIVVSTLTVGGSAKGSNTDGGTSKCIALAMNSQYLYASFTDSNTVGTFAVQTGCSLTFLNDAPVVGLQGGIINGMAVHGNLLIATYTDGSSSIESFNISAALRYRTATNGAIFQRSILER